MEPAEERQGSEGSKSVRLSVTVPKEHHEELTRIAVKNRVSVAWVVRAAVERYVTDEAPLLYQVR